MKARMLEDRAPQLREGYVSASEAATLCSIKDVGTIHKWIKGGAIRGRRNGVGKFAPWYANVWDLLKMHEEAAGAETVGTAGNKTRNALRAFVRQAINSGELPLAKK